ncbi:hypothetical protein [Kineococcus sp. SYSU DK005]|uniref:hypothetical protein n=1 Tax=Kineococcus sp. SYSU DK005 TaxID=3383126 RepID=UPI003D7D8E68
MFGKKDDDGKTQAEKVQAVLDPGLAHRTWSVLDAGAAGRQRDVMRAYEQIKLVEALLAEQQRTNRLLEQLVRAAGQHPVD